MFDDVVGDQSLLLLNFPLITLAPHQTLHSVNGVLWVGRCLAFGNLSNQAFTRSRESDNAGSGAGAVRVGDDNYFWGTGSGCAFEHSHARVGGA